MRKRDWTFEDRLRFDISMALKNSKRNKRKYDDDDPYGPIAYHILEQLRLAGWRIESTGRARRHWPHFLTNPR